MVTMITDAHIWYVKCPLLRFHDHNVKESLTFSHYHTWYVGDDVRIILDAEGSKGAITIHH